MHRWSSSSLLAICTRSPARPVTASEDGPPSGGLGGSADLASERGGCGWLGEAGGGGGGGGGMHLAGPGTFFGYPSSVYIGRRRRLLREEGTLATIWCKVHIIRETVGSAFFKY